MVVALTPESVVISSGSGNGSFGGSSDDGDDENSCGRSAEEVCNDDDNADEECDDDRIGIQHKPQPHQPYEASNDGDENEIIKPLNSTTLSKELGPSTTMSPSSPPSLGLHADLEEELEQQLEEEEWEVNCMTPSVHAAAASTNSASSFSPHSPYQPPPVLRPGIMVNNSSSSLIGGGGGSESRRHLLVRVGSWMKQSWRSSRSSRSLASMSSISSLGDLTSSVRTPVHEHSGGIGDVDGSSRNNNDYDGVEEDAMNDNLIIKVPKNVKFEDDDFLVTVMPTMPMETLEARDTVEIEDDQIKSEGPSTSLLWFDDHDYKRFEKDRVLSVLGYEASKRGATTFDQTHHTIRGLEASADQNWRRRQEGEKKDLYRAIKLEEKRQKDDGCFPDLDRFRIVSRRHTKGSKERSQRMGQEDANAVGIKTSTKPSLFRRRSSRSLKTTFKRRSQQQQHSNTPSSDHNVSSAGSSKTTPADDS